MICTCKVTVPDTVWYIPQIKDKLENLNNCDNYLLECKRASLESPRGHFLDQLSWPFTCYRLVILLERSCHIILASECSNWKVNRALLSLMVSETEIIDLLAKRRCMLWQCCNRSLHHLCKSLQRFFSNDMQRKKMLRKVTYEAIGRIAVWQAGKSFPLGCSV